MPLTCIREVTVRVQNGTPAVTNVMFCLVSLQSVRANAEILSYTRPGSLPSEYFTIYYLLAGRDNSVGIVTGYELNDPGIESRCGAGFSALVRTYPESRPVSYTVDIGCFPRVKPPGPSVDYPAHQALRLKKE